MYEVEEINIENLIYNIRGKQVMLDRDLAILYKTETRVINQLVKRNKERFPDDFCFQLNDEEFIFWKSQNVISISDKKGLRRPPYVFTEQGVAMLSALIKSNIAIKVSVSIMNAFVYMRKYIKENLMEQAFVNEMVFKHEKDIKLLQKIFDNLEESKNQIFFDGQIYDSYSKIVDIFKKAKNELIIVDGYADKIVLDIISRLKVKVILITKQKSLLNELDIEKYNKQYNNLNIIYDDTFHDRYFILDKEIFYHCGTSINYIGSKTFSINKLEDEIVIKSLINRIKNI